MTILGAFVSGPQYAIAWTDAEAVKPSGESAGYCNKMAVNAHAAMVCMGTGWSKLIGDAIGEAMRAASFDEALRRLPTFLRRNAERTALQAGNGASDYGRQVVALVGHSHELARMAGFELAASSCFQPVLQNRICMPHVPAFDGLNPECGPGGLIRVVKQQLANLQEWVPGVTGGTLVVAHLRPGLVTCGPYLDLVQNAELEGAPSPVRPSLPAHKFALSRPAPLAPEFASGVPVQAPDANAEAVQEGSAWTARSIFHRQAA